MSPRTPVGAISIVADHPARPYEIQVDDEFPLGDGRRLTVRSSSLVAAAEMLAHFLEFEVHRRAVLARADDTARAAVARASWRRFAAGYRAAVREACGDLGECCVALDGRALDPRRDWSPDCAHVMNITLAEVV